MNRLAALTLALLASFNADAADAPRIGGEPWQSCGEPSQMVVPQTCGNGGMQTMTLTWTPVRNSEGRCEVQESVRLSGCTEAAANTCFKSMDLPYAGKADYQLLVVNDKGATYEHATHGTFTVPCPDFGNASEEQEAEEPVSCTETRTYAVETTCPSGTGVRRDFYYYFQTERNGQCVRAQSNPVDGDFYSHSESECTG